MKLYIKEVSNKKELSVYIHLPFSVNKADKNWLPPVIMDEWLFHDPKKNKSYSYCDTVRFLAYDNMVPVGRIMGIINHRYNEIHRLSEARFFQLESYNKPEVVELLLTTIENWAKTRRISKLIGPYGFSDKDPQGLQIEGFNEPKVIVTPTNPEYLVALVENFGYTKEIDCVSYKIEVPKTIPPFYERICQRSLKMNHLRLIEPRYKIELYRWIRPVLSLVNETYTEIYGFAPFEPHEMDAFANRYMPILDPKFVKILVDKDSIPVAFILGIRDISKGIQKCKGKVLPFGIFEILWHQKRSRQLDLLLGAVKGPYRGNGFDALLGAKILETAIKTGIKNIDSHLILEKNHPMRMEIEKLGGKIYKRYRVFQKALN